MSFSCWGLAQKSYANDKDFWKNSFYLSIGYRFQNQYSPTFNQFLSDTDKTQGSGSSHDFGIDFEIYLPKAKSWLLIFESYGSISNGTWGDLAFNQFSQAVGGGYKFISKKKFFFTPSLLFFRQKINFQDASEINDLTLLGGRLQSKAHWLFSYSKYKLSLSLAYGISWMQKDSYFIQPEKLIPKGTIFHDWYLGLSFGGRLFFKKRKNK